MSLTVEEVEAILRLKDELSGPLNKAGSSLQSFGKAATMVGAGLTAAISLPILAIGVSALKLGVHAAESEDLFKRSFGGMEDAARKWSEGLAESLGLNDFALRESAGMLNLMFGSMKIGEKAAYDMSTSLTELAVDMSSAFDISIVDAMDKIRAGITGETEPLKRLGILLDEDSVKRFAQEKGMIRVGQEMTAQQKVMARHMSLLDQTQKIQGNYADTADGAANTIRSLTETLTKLGTELGVAMLPALKQVLELTKALIPYIQGAVQWFTSLSPSVQLIVIGTLGLAAAIGPLLVMFGVMATSVASLAAIFGTTAAAIAAFTGIGALMIAGVASWIYVFKNLDVIVWAVKAVYEGIKTWLVDKFIALVDMVRGPIDAVKGYFTGLYDALVGHSIVPDGTNAILAEFERMGGGMDEKSKKAAAKVTKNMKELYEDVAKMEGDFASAAVVLGNHLDHTAVLWNKNRELVHENAEAFRALSFEINATPKTVTADLFDPATVREFNKELTAMKELYAWIAQKDSDFQNQRGLVQMAKDAGVAIDELVPKGQAAVGGLLTSLKSVGKSAMGDLNNVFQRAFEGGGGIGGAVKSMATNLTSGLMSMIPVVGPFISQFSGAIVAGFSKIGGLFGFGKSEGRKQLDEANAQIDKMKAKLLEQYGSLEAIREKGGQAGEALAAAWGSQNREGLAHFNTLLGEFNTEMARVGQVTSLVQDLLGTKQVDSLKNLEAAYQQLTPEQLENKRVVENLVRMYVQLRDQTGITIDGLEQLAQSHLANADATKQNDEATRLARGTFAGLSGDIDKLQAQFANAEAIQAFQAELEKARTGGQFSFASMLSAFETLKGSLGDTPQIQALREALVHASATGKFEFEKFATIFAQLMAGMNIDASILNANLSRPIVKIVQIHTVDMAKAHEKEWAERASDESKRDAIRAWLQQNPGDRARLPSGLGISLDEVSRLGFRHGTLGRYINFGSGTPVMMHGEERIVTKSEGQSETNVMVMMLSALRSIDQRLSTLPVAVASAAATSQR